MSKGYRGFPSKKAYEEYYSDPASYADEMQSMQDYVNECEQERKQLTRTSEVNSMILHLASPTKYLGDTVARKGVEITIRHDGLVIWINIDGQCMSRIIMNGMVPIIIEDNRSKIIEKPYLSGELEQ